MKKIILTSAIVLTAIAGAFAQSESADVKLNVVLNKVQSLEIADNSVTLTYNTKDDYLNGVGETKKSHVTVYSTGPFAVSVAAADLNETDGKTLPSNSIKVTATKVGEFAGTTSTSVPLATSAAKVIVGTTAAFGKAFDIRYQGAGDGMYMNDLYSSKNATKAFNTIVTYTIAPN